MTQEVGVDLLKNILGGKKKYMSWSTYSSQIRQKNEYRK